MTGSSDYCFIDMKMNLLIAGLGLLVYSTMTSIDKKLLLNKYVIKWSMLLV